MEALLEILGKVGFDTPQFVMNVVSFGIIYWIFSTKFLPLIKQTLKERQEKIEAGLNASDEAKEKLAEAESEALEIIAKAKSNSSEILEKTNEQSKDILVQAAATAEEKKQDALKKAQAEIENDRAQMEREVAKEAGVMIADGVKKVLADGLTSQMQEQIVSNTKSK